VGDATTSVRVRLTVAYRGDGFRGWAANAGVRSVEGTLAEALETVLRAPVALAVGGRTDAGVHAEGQVVSLDAPADADLDDLVHRVNALVGPEVAVLDAVSVPADFHARFSATSRRYRYRVLNRRAPDPFRQAVTWHIPAPLDVDAMARGAAALVGEHDFSAFCRRPKQPADASLVRCVTEATWVADGDEKWFLIEANAFCHQMVRSIVGLLALVGSGRRRAEHVGAVLAARDRTAVRADPAPPHGLTLVVVRY
jgi:tRNA pseudouridine38-40 synthase